MNDTETLTRRAAGRQLARDLISVFANDINDVDTRAFLDELRTIMLPADKIPKPTPKPIPLAQLEKTILPFGKYLGHFFDDVPFEYLDWLCRENERFLKVLQQYLKHPDLNR